MRYFCKNNILLILIIFLSIALRFLFLDKINGLSYDEIIGTYNEINQPNILSLILNVFKFDIHMPLYQIILYYWSKIFSLSDYSLRAFSAVCGIAAVIVSYFIGKELNTKQTGLICALIFATNSFLIYYSQEARMYSFMALLVCIFLLFLIKIKTQYENKWNYIGFVLSAFAVIISYPTSLVFVVSQIIIFTIFLIFIIKKDKKVIAKKLLISIGALILLCTPLLCYFLLNQNKYLGFFNGFYFDAYSILLIMQNWFTPVIEPGTPTNYIHQIISDFGLNTITFIFIPILFSISSIIYAIKKDKFSIVILSSAIIFIITEIIATKFTNFKIVSRYTMVIVPNFIILVGYGLSLIEKKLLKTIIISIFTGINLFYLLFMSNSAIRMQRDGFKQLAQILISNNIEQNDIVVVWNNRSVLKKYIDKELNVIGLLGNIAYTSEIILNNQNEINKLSPEKRKILLRPYFASPYIPINNIYLMDIIYKRLKPNQKFIITTNSYFDSFTQESFTKFVNNNKEYEKMSYNNLLCIKALIGLKKLSAERFHSSKKINDKNNVVIIFKK